MVLDSSLVVKSINAVVGEKPTLRSTPFQAPRNCDTSEITNLFSLSNNIISNSTATRFHSYSMYVTTSRLASSRAKIGPQSSNRFHFSFQQCHLVHLSVTSRSHHSCPSVTCKNPRTNKQTNKQQQKKKHCSYRFYATYQTIYCMKLV